MYDEAGYWEKRDESLLRKNFEFMAGLLDGFSNVLENGQMKPGEDFSTFITRMAEKFHKERKR